jgi:hypothetical protein
MSFAFNPSPMTSPRRSDVPAKRGFAFVITLFLNNCRVRSGGESNEGFGPNLSSGGESVLPRNTERVKMGDFVRRCKLVSLAFLSNAFLWVGPAEGQGEWEPNMIVGTQAIGGPYQFTDENYLIEVAREIEALGSNLIKFAMNPRMYTKRPYYLDEVDGIRSMANLLEKHPVYREVMDMPFRFYHIWANPYKKPNWQDGLTEREEEAIYKDFHDLTTYLLTKYANSGKVFLLGHWEGDWILKGATDPTIDPTPERIQGFAQYLNIRQRAIEDARNELVESGAWVYHYTEVNMVRKGIDGSRPTLTNSVLPLVDIDFVSYSSYDVIQRDSMREELFAALDHIESQLRPRSDIKGKRVFVGEYAIKARSVEFDEKKHDRRNREVTRAMLEWGCPFIIYWQFYCNEKNAEGLHEGYWLVNDEGEQVILYETFRDYYAGIKEFMAEEKMRTGRFPTDREIRAFAIEMFE